MDVSLSVRFTAAERWEKGAARRVLIDSDRSLVMKSGYRSCGLAAASSSAWG